MAYQSKHTGAAIDNGIDINTTQNNRLTTIEGNISSLQTLLNNIQTSLNTTISNIQTQLNELAEELENIEIPDIKLNYSVVGGTTQPTNPVENMIWVNTNQSITNYLFGKIKPSNPTNGTVWFKTGDNSNTMLYSLTFNNTYVDAIYPLSAQQYINNAWVTKIAKTYQNNKWNTWLQLIYNSNTLKDDFVVLYNTSDGAYGRFSFSDKMNFSYAEPGGSDIIVYKKDPVYIRNGSIIRIKASFPTIVWADYNVRPKFGIVSNLPLNASNGANWVAVKEIVSPVSTITEYTLQINGLEGYYYFVLYSAAATGYVYEVVIE